MTTIHCAAVDCTRRGEHLTNCTLEECTGCWPRPADHGFLCQRHYDRVDAAIQVAERLTRALRDVERAVRADTNSSSVAGPRVPLTVWQLDLDSIERARADKTTVDQTGHAIHLRDGYRGDLDTWINSNDQAVDALDFARLVHAAEQRHPLEDRPTRMRRVRCGGCGRLTVINQPPDWYTAHRTLVCTDPACGWTTTDEDHAEAAAHVEALLRDPYSRSQRKEDLRRITDDDRARIANLLAGTR